MTNELAWMSQRMRRIMAGMHIPDYDQLDDETRSLMQKGVLPGLLTRLDVKELIAQLKDAGVQAFWIYCKGGYGNAFYPSKVGHVHSAMQGRDLFGELCEACLAADILPLGIYETSDARVVTEHPEWCHTADLERSRPDNGCIFSPYGEFEIEQTLEVVKQYPIKAYYLDALGCGSGGDGFCPNCAKAFRQDCGFDFPGRKALTPEQMNKYIRWANRRIGEYAERVRQIVRQVRPDIAFTANGVVRRPPVCDFISCDLFAHEAGSLGISSGLRRNAGLSAHPPGEVLLDTVTHELLTPKGADAFIAELWTARSLNVAACTSYIMAMDGSAPAEQMALAGRAFKSQIALEPWLTGMESVFQVGILNSHDSRKFRPNLSEGPNPIPPPHLLECAGWMSAAIAGHFLWDYVDDLQMTSECLARYRVLILPAASCLSAAQVQAVAGFVRAGGTLIATGDTSLFNADGVRQPNFQLAEMLGVDLAGERREDCVFLLPEQAEPMHWNLGQWPVKARPGARVRVFAGRSPSFKPFMIAPVKTDLPASVEHSYGKGRVFYFAGLPGMQYGRTGLAAPKQFMIRVLKEALGNEHWLEVAAPETVEVFAHRQAAQRRLVVNLVSSPGSGARSFRKDGFEDVDVIPEVSGSLIRFRAPGVAKAPRQVYLAPDRQPLPVTRRGADWQVALPSFHIHAAVVVEDFG